MVTPKLCKKRPTMPLMKATGKKTAISESVVARTARPTSRVAAQAAMKGFSFFSSMNRRMFSRTTMASSITIPTARASARRVIMLSVKPITCMSANVPMIEMGMASAAMRVLRTFPRKSKTMRAAKKAPRIRCSRTAARLVRIDCELSRTTRKVGPGNGLFDLKVRRARTASATATVFWPDCLRTESTSTCSPSSEAQLFSSSLPSSTRATSITRVAWSLLSRTTIWPNAATLLTRPSTRREMRRGPVLISLPGTVMFWRRESCARRRRP